MYKLIFVAFLIMQLNAYDLELKNGMIKAHTEIFGDNEIDPISKEIDSKLTMEDSIESVRGVIHIQSMSLKSKKSDRDENMYELLNVNVYPIISFNIKNIIKIDAKYKILGTLRFNGITKEITSLVAIDEKDSQLKLNGDFSIKLTQFNLEPPSLFFVTVRDKIDISYSLVYNKK